MSVDLAAILADEWRACDDPAYFIENYCRIENKNGGNPIIPFDLWEGQKKALADIHREKMTIVLKARQLGISWLVVCYAAYMMLKVDGCTVLALSRTETEAKELVRRLGLVLDNMPEWIGNGRRWRKTQNALSVSVVGEGLERRFTAFASSPGAARSFTADLIIFDEWAFQAYAEEIWTSGFPTINRPGGGKVIGLSTMALGTFFAKQWSDPDSGFYKIFLPWDTDPRRTVEWYANARKVLGESVYSEYPATPEEAMLAPVGAFFDEFRREYHVCEPFPVPECWRRYMAIDYGLDMLAALWLAVDDEGRAVVYREVYEPGLTIAQASAAILAAEDDREDIYQRFAPPDLFGRSQESGRTRTDIFRENGLVFDKASNDREAGWANIKDWLRADADEMGTARLRIFKSCPNLIRTLQAIPRDKKRPSDCAKEPHELTHAPESLRYLLSMRPQNPDTTVPKGTRIYYTELDSFLSYGT